MKPLVRFHKSVGLLVLLNLLLKPLWIFVVDRNVQLHFGNELYGEYYVLLNLSLIFTVFIDFGLTNYYIFTQAKAPTAKPSELLPTILLIKIFGSLIYLFITILSFFILEYQQFILLLVLCIVQIASSYLLSLRAVLQAKQNYTTDSFFSVFDKTLAIVIMLGILLIPTFLIKFSITLYAIVQLLSILLSFGLLFFFLQKKYSGTPFLQKSGESIYKTIRKALPFALVIISMTLLLRSDIIILKWLKGNEANGQYVYGFRLFDTLNNFGYLAASFLFPFFCFHLQHKNMIRKTAMQYANMGSLLIVFGIIILFFTKQPISLLLYKQFNYSIVAIIIFCSVAFLGTWWVHIFSSLLTANKSLKSLLITTTFFIIPSVLLNWIYVPQYGALASATILAIIQLLYGFSLYLLCLHKKLI